MKLIEKIAQIEHVGRTLKLQRAWPRSKNHLLVEYVGNDGQIVPGQWLADKNKLNSIYKQTLASCTGSSCTLACVNEIEILLQPSGADRKLIGLPQLLADEAATLISHRPERRAVVKLGNNDQLRFAKVLRTSKYENIISIIDYVINLPNLSFDVPQIIERNSNDGVAVLSQLVGSSLFDLLSSEIDLQIISEIGKAIRSLHDSKPIANASVHDSEAEIEVVKRWISFAESFDCQIANDVKVAAPAVIASLRETSSDLVLLHRDFYDKQIFVSQDYQIGILDFDTLAIGEAALDLANVLVHLELRSLQGNCSSAFAANAALSLLTGYGQVNALAIKRLSAYENAARLRLACVYAFRPNLMEVSKKLVESCAFY